MKDILKFSVYGSLFLVLFIPVLVTDSMFFPYITGKNFIFRILVELALVSWVLLAFLDKSYRPRFSFVMVSSLVFLLVMFFANLLGQHPHTSFWSNYERMDGYVTLVHFFLYFVVLGSVLKDKKMWNYFFLTSIAVASYVAMYGLAQSAGVIEGRNRVDSTLGNAAYMAIYMLFNIFLVLLVANKTKDWFLRAIYGVIFVLFTYILLETGTRGTFLGLIGGLGIVALYLIIFARSYPEVRKFAGGVVLLLVFLIGGLFTFKDSTFITENDALNRIASINLSEDLKIRQTIWSMALEGVKERPILGWGQGNFNYIFNREFRPSLYGGEQWFDRVHNIVLDWLVAGGVLGLVAYLSIFIATLFYLFIRPLFIHDADNNDTSFTVTERAIILGILGGYLIHNFVVFDNLVSYSYFAIILAFIHSQVATPINFFEKFDVDQQIVANILAPVLIVAFVATCYFVHMPGYLAARDIIEAFKTGDVNQRFTEFQQALDRGSFARQEIVEQLAQQSINLGREQRIPPEAKLKYLQMAEAEIANLIKDKPGDARLHVFFSGFYRSVGDYNKAKEQIDIARSLSPNKQTIILEQGLIALGSNRYEDARDYFKEAFLLDENFDKARFLYAGTLLYTGEADKVRELITDDLMAGFANSDFGLRAARDNNDTELLTKMIEAKIEANPFETQNYASLAFIRHSSGDEAGAISILEEGIEKVPMYAKTKEEIDLSKSFVRLANCYIGNLKAGEVPDKGCQ